jgi:hypothetical protein
MRKEKSVRRQSMKIDWNFPKRVLVTLAVIALIGIYPLIVYGTPEIITGIIAGSVISLLNVLLGYVAIEYAIDKSNKTFLKAVLGGMGLRLVGSLTAVLILIEVYDIHISSFVASLLTLYFIFMLYEIMFFNKKLSLRK